MSSNDEQDAQSKKRRTQRTINRACDICRRKKIRCDGPEMPGNRCSNCLACNFDCSYVEAAKKRGPPKGYVESMEIRIEKIERLLQTLLPEADLERALSRTSVASWQALPVADDDERAQLSLIENLQQLSLNSDIDPRFFGRSSGAMLIQTAMNLKLDAEPQNDQRHTEFWDSRPSPEPTPPPQYNFPPSDLAASLVDLYFAHINLLLPLLHRPTFARDLAAGLHLTNDGFAATYLLVCAIGARYSSDPRVLLDGSDNLFSCGWRWFEQLQLMRDPLGPSPCLYDLQFNVLLVLFLDGTSCPQACWTAVAVGIRMAQDVGAHRRKEATHQWTAEDELWKRAFWVLVFLDRTLSCTFGRPCAIQDEDFDLELPIDCDDEYWETPDPADAFQQPKGKPSLISAFIAHLRLGQVLSFALRTIYSINKSKFLLGLSNGNIKDWEYRIVKELDLALNKWVDEMPDHLRWNPTHENDEFFEQSTLLYCSYYQLQILIHREYLPNPKRPPAFLNPKDASSNNIHAFPSVAICLNAAHSCIHFADIHRERTGERPLPMAQMALFTAGLVLLLNIWGGQRSGLGLSANLDQEMAEVHRCMRVLRVCEMRWQSVGRMWDVLFDIASVGQLPLPATVNPKNKRERGAEEPKSVTAPQSESELTSPISAGDGNAPAREPHHRPIAADGSHFMPIVGTSEGFDPTRRPMAGRRLHPLEVPAITTQFLHRSQVYPPDTPLSTSSLHSPDKYAMPMHEVERLRSYVAGLETPLSSSSGHGHRPEVFVPSMQRAESRHHALTHRHPASTSPHPLGPSDTPLSAASLHGPQYVPSMHQEESHPRTRTQPDTTAPTHVPFVLSNNGLGTLPQRFDFSHSREILDESSARGDWYPNHARTMHRVHDHGASIHLPPPHASSSSSPDSNPPLAGVSGSAGSSSFPVSEAFYEHLTASFASPPHRYAEAVHHEYSDGGRSLHRVPSNLSAHSDHGPIHVHRSTETHPQLSRAPRGGHAHVAMDPDAMAMWSTAPVGFEMEDWTPYLDNMQEMTQARGHPGTMH
ncbi:fungal-specific transcription factor domain-containing protein [Mycena galopus ATCC 62051]|nr:fungal-specific transcription factor domain-containing protein [Mycena galopus ATCC 62051]